MKSKLYGIHWIAGYSGCEGRSPSGKLVIDDAEFLRSVISKGLKNIGADIFAESVKQFDPQGATVLIGISESHASAHSWPEDGFIEFDFNTCNLDMDGDWLLDYLAEEFGAGKFYFSKIMRYTDFDEVVESKEVIFEE